MENKKHSVEQSATDTSSPLALQISVALMAGLFFYTAASKLINYERSRAQMLIQVFPVRYAELLSWLVPAAELLIALLMLIPATRRKGIILFMILMILFTGYILLILTNTFHKVPCSCGGFLESMSWKTHLIFNTFFIILSILTLKRKEVWRSN